jgi:xanthine dehydrogenase YagT iron-sulfur-binding subunit
MGHEDRDKDEKPSGGVSRRGFISSVGTGAIGVAAAGALVNAAPVEQPGADIVKAGDMIPVTLVVNGRKQRLLVEPRWSLLHVLRDQFGMTGTKVGCERGECGACTVLIDGQPRYACMTLAVEADLRAITTIEGLMTGEELGLTQRAFAEEDGFQCGYCTPGQVMAAEGLLKVNPSPNIDEIRQGMAGNICRCGAYANIFRAVAKAADLKRQGR